MSPSLIDSNKRFRLRHVNRRHTAQGELLPVIAQKGLGGVKGFLLYGYRVLQTCF